jgi:hypothetical protein
MARIRTIKPDAFTSDSLAHVPRGVRWTFAGIWTYVDDSGRGRDDVRLIKAALYPLDDEVSLSVLADDLDQLEKIGCLCRYEVDGKTYIHIPGWRHQKISHPTPSQLPNCSRHNPEDSGPAPEPLPNDSGALQSRSALKGKERKGKEQGARGRATSDPMFDAFWSAYPRRAGKPAAIKAWKAALKRGADPSSLVGLAGSYAKANAVTDIKFIPYPQKWLNDERYNDEQPAETTQAKTYWTPPPPPREIADDPDKYAAYYAEQAANREVS